jgi:hypothetical protein
LRSLSILAPGIVNFQHSYDIFAIFELIEYLILSTDVLASLLGSFHGHCLLGFEVKSFKNIPE